MANEEQLAILKNSIAAWNAWRVSNFGLQPDLRQANLAGMDLHNANFVRVNLIAANLRKANLTDANLIKANLSEANLAKANLNGANLSSSNLTEANLTEARLILANLTRANIIGARLEQADLSRAILNEANLVRVVMRGANFTNTSIGLTTFVDVDLSEVDGLDTVRHRGPTSIGVDTIYRSKGSIPDVFLRGAGLPDTFITYASSLVGKPFQFFSSFISHSSKDQAFSDRLYADLLSKGVRTWYFPEDAKWGETVWGEIDRSIKIYDKLIVVCSENSLQSGPVNREIERALVREDKESKGILFPIRIDDYIFNTWEHERKADVLRKVVGDFSGWNKDAAKYDKAFDKLLKGLQAESGKA